VVHAGAQKVQLSSLECIGYSLVTEYRIYTVLQLLLAVSILPDDPSDLLGCAHHQRSHQDVFQHEGKGKGKMITSACGERHGCHSAAIL
jgi:hypothetical protein